MRNFFKRLFRIFRPDSSKYVRNMKAGPQQKVHTSFNQPGRKMGSKTILAWIMTSDIRENKENDSGITVEIVLKKEKSFTLVTGAKEVKVHSKKKGLSNVEHLLRFKADEAIRASVAEQAEKGPLTFIYRSPDAEYLILGESQGLKMMSLDNGTLEFTGEESDVFFRISEECFYELLPNIEK